MSTTIATKNVATLKGRHFLTLADYSKSELESLLQLAKALKKWQQQGKTYQPLAGKTLGMIFTKASTRTRVSFEVGMLQLGGHALFLGKDDIQLGRGETIPDTARVLSRYVDGIMIRTFAHRDVIELARYATVPVINGLTDAFHPCQALADFLTIEEKLGGLKGSKLAYVGDGNNMVHSLMLGAAKLGVHIAVATPTGYEPDTDVVRDSEQFAQESGSSVTVTNDPLEAVNGAHVIYTDVWASMGQEAEAQERLKAFQGYQVDKSLMDAAHDHAIFLHCLPAHRGEEVAAEVIDGPKSVVFSQAENRLHAQKAILASLL
mgnify:CR=1 FL=1